MMTDSNLNQMEEVTKKPNKVPKKCFAKRQRYYTTLPIYRNLTIAVAAVKENGLSIRSAAARFGIPRSTLSNKLRNPNAGTQFSKPTVLSPQEEESIVDWIQSQNKADIPVKRTDVQNRVHEILTNIPRTNTFKNNRPGKKWMLLFLARHPEIRENNNTYCLFVDDKYFDKDFTVSLMTTWDSTSTDIEAQVSGQEESREDRNIVELSRSVMPEYNMQESLHSHGSFSISDCPVAVKEEPKDADEEVPAEEEPVEQMPTVRTKLERITSTQYRRGGKQKTEKPDELPHDDMESDNQSSDEMTVTSGNDLYVIKPCSISLDRSEVEKYYCPESATYDCKMECRTVVGTHVICRGCGIKMKVGVYDKHKSVCKGSAKYCLTCKKYFYNAGHFISHQAVCSYSFQCPDCPRIFKMKDQLTFHLNSCHKKLVQQPEQLVRKFNHSLTFFPRAKKLESTTNKKLLIHCITCGIDFHYKTYLCEHINECIKQPNYVCPECNLSKSNSNINLLHHLVHLERHAFKDWQKCYTCDSCDNFFVSHSNLQIHRSRIHMKKIIMPKGGLPKVGHSRINNATPLTYTNKDNSLGIVIKDVHSINSTLPANCVITLEQVAGQQTLNLKEKMIEEEIVEEETIIKKESDYKDLTSSITEHYRYDIVNFVRFLKEEVLLPEALVFCSTCSEMFDVENYLNHVLTCLQKEEFTCPMCPKCNRRKYSMEYCLHHVKKHFMETTESMCTMCRDTFFNEHNMAIHAQFKHFM